MGVHAAARRGSAQGPAKGRAGAEAKARARGAAKAGARGTGAGVKPSASSTSPAKRGAFCFLSRENDCGTRAGARDLTVNPQTRERIAMSEHDDRQPRKPQPGPGQVEDPLKKEHDTQEMWQHLKDRIRKFFGG